jgi:uncharacterized membrane protein YgdD (TMEM256/DUF423 family)
LIGVACGAFGAHGLEGKISPHMMEIWNKAVLYNLIHAAACLWASQRSSHVALWLWTTGVALFSGSLYFYALLGTYWLVFLTPIGGMFFLAGWLTVIVKPKG